MILLVRAIEKWQQIRAGIGLQRVPHLSLLDQVLAVNRQVRLGLPAVMLVGESDVIVGAG